MMYHTRQIPEIIRDLNTALDTGLSATEAAQRLTQFGPNLLPAGPKTSKLKRFLLQFKDLLIFILLGAAGISLAIGEIKDGTVILTIVIANALMGYYQEMKADNAIAALKKMSVTHAKVWRDQKMQLIEAAELVPGDVIIIENGDKIPADARLTEAVCLHVLESSLTGESRPVEKNAMFVGPEHLPLGDRANMVYKDTVVMMGRGQAIVTATGQRTEVGAIFEMLQHQEEKTTTLSQELGRVGQGLTIFAGISVLIIFGAMSLSATPDFKNAFLTAIAMAIAVVPEGIPAVVTTVLAISVVRLARHRAIIRKLEAVETLGAATCILTDKTGTLTQNVMTVTDLFLPTGTWQINHQVFSAPGSPDLQWFLTCAVLCNDAKTTSTQQILGDPTEGCLVLAAHYAGLDSTKLRADYPRRAEIPFSSETKKMTVVVESPTGQRYVITKGAVESVLPQCLPQTVSEATTITADLAQKGIRNLVLSYKEIAPTADLTDHATLLMEHHYLGVVGMMDPLRPEVKSAVALAARAGVRTIMITGDHQLIARSIGQQLGIIQHPADIVDGAELDHLSDPELHQLLSHVNAFSRVSPAQKLRIVQAVKARGETVIVTGDGVNDAPAIKTADIGVAMGISGTDVAKEAADMVLQDDNYATIVEAIKQGRGIFGNFIKFLIYQVSCNLSGVIVVFSTTILGYATPLLPVHILLLNLVSETAPSIALGLEKPEKNVMFAKPRPKNEHLLTRRRWYKIICEALFLASAGITTYFWLLPEGYFIATSGVLATTFLSRLWHALNSRSATYSVFSRNLQLNIGLLLTVIGTLSILVLSLYTPWGNLLLKTVPLSASIIGKCVGLSLIPLILVEIYKQLVRWQFIKVK